MREREKEGGRGGGGGGSELSDERENGMRDVRRGNG